MGYSRNPMWQWENEVSSATVGIILAVIVVGAAILLTLLLILLQELWRIYKERGREPTGAPASRLLWGVLAAFIAVLILAVILAVTTGAVGVAAAIASWGFLFFVIAVEVVDHMAPRSINAPDGDGLVLGEAIA